MNLPLKQFWLLSIFSGMERAGCAPFHITDLNILYYYSNALANFFKIPMIDPVFDVSEDFIFYPDLSFDLEKLETIGFIKENEPCYMHITRNGLNLIKNWKTQREIVDLNVCISLAYGRNPDVYKHIFERDPNISLNLTIDKESHNLNKKNYVHDQVEYLHDQLQKKYPWRKDKSLAVNYYFQYLNGL